ncbi:type III-A CRISPR-associated RAMP protein Csm5 [Desulfoferrobacter suflitae]|uniref:type III-A CRISPR-associated RAMP protein Csm5 n=1 Tax=Desulfoferrobacter suflitae TaxID=2865782 RepID=UPI002164BC33|nr:type III-A CRISPR-associated RAMP protein Csm5 [Desulfoferrobacter suflitae]MCK8603007.1 type III-A CRISPR-associated RAMP protein Csm5 [Desulfoferrobacter suflitae]
MNAPVKCYLRVLSPLHVGCDEVLEPLAFRVDEAAHQLIHLDPFDFIKGLDPAEKTQFAQLCRKGTIASILELYKFMRNRSFPGTSIELCSGFVDHYRKVLGIPLHDASRIQKEINSFCIARTATNPTDGRCYIPGSSIKGMLRTAYLNILAKHKRVPTPRGRAAADELERRLLEGGNFATDPFRMVKISDFVAVGEVKTRIMYAVNRKKVPSRFEARGPYQMLETVVPGGLFTGWISVQQPEVGSGIKRPLTFEELMGSAKSFYGRELMRENGDLASIGAEQVHTSGDSNALPVRLGRHSGAECLTIEGHRSIKIMRARGQAANYAGNATTLWLAANSSNPSSNRFLLPFGWAALGQVNDQLGAAFARQEEEFTAKLAKASATTRVYPSKQLTTETDKPKGEVSGGSVQAQDVRASWPNAILSWSPGNALLTATWQGKKATISGKELVPQSLHKKLFGKKKSATAHVEVEPIGNAFRLVAVKEAE